MKVLCHPDLLLFPKQTNKNKVLIRIKNNSGESFHLVVQDMCVST